MSTKSTAEITMNIQELRQQLESEYTLVCFEDLADVSASPFYVYNLFYRFYKTAYKPNERLVFYSNETPSDKLVEHLYRAAELIDISEFFIMIHSSINDARPLQNNFTVPDTLCPMPWMHLEIGQTGKVRPCCIYSDRVHNIQDHTLQEIFNSDVIASTRQHLLDGERIHQCSGCWDMEKQGVTSHRQRHLQMLGRDFLGKYVSTPEIKSLDIKASNACNFKCRICNAGNSSLHAAEQAKFENIIVKHSDSHVDSLFKQQLPELVSQLENLDFYGGEPFFLKQILNFVEDAAIDGHAEHLRLHFNTNGSIYPEKLEKYWQQFKHVDIHFSVDDIDQRFELQRGGSWEQVESNIKRFVSLQLPNMSLNLMPAISIMNVFYLDELFDWADNLGLSVYPIMVEKPEEFSFDELTQQAKDAILNKYKNSKHPEIQKFYSVISKVAVKPDAGNQFKNKIAYFDGIRNESFQTSHYEIAKLMGMC